jgi:3-isopropylmalate/(R)-2-methylmalate dehydratase small subunit
MPIERIVRLSGRGLPLRGNDIDTDRIIPARFLKSVSFDGLETHLFEDDIAQNRAQGVTHAMDDPRFAGARVLIVNRNFGCGSSREHAPQAIRRRGFVAVAGESFSEIFFGNSVAIGLPCVTASPADIERLQRIIEENPAVELTVVVEALHLRCGDVQMNIGLPPGTRESFVDGSWDATGLLLERYEEVEQTIARVPYVRGWMG